MNSINIFPQTPEAMNAFRLILQMPNDEMPIVEMNDQTARDLKIIGASIEALAARWRGKSDIRFPGMPMNRQEFWGAFAADHEPQILPIVKEFIENSSGQGKTAIDLGCGNSSATRLLLEKGWRVIAVDNSKSALNILIAKNKAQVKSGQLKIIEADVSTFTPSMPVDLVIAADIFPYINPSEFQSTWSKIHTYVKENGFLVGSLFRILNKPEQLSQMNLMKEMGAWCLPDRRMVRPFLTSTGYAIKTCKYRIDEAHREPICIQFIAEKKTINAEPEETI